MQDKCFHFPRQVLEVTMPGAEARLQLDFAEQFRDSELSRCGLPLR